jgi:4-amino-4-deoxy-L-arabinose transferase-like glycosyltransferase
MADAPAPTRADRRTARRWYVIGCLAIVAVALVLRFAFLGSQSFWIDEISVTSFVRSGHVLSDLRDRGGPFEPPLHFLGVLAALQLPIDFETAARVPSALFGALEVLALILLAREATNRRATALVAGALLAVAPFAIRYSQENRYYVMFSALNLLSWWLLLRAYRLRRTRDWLAYGAAAAAMQLTHPFAPASLLAQALLIGFLIWRARGSADTRVVLRGYGIAVLLGLILILPWYVYGAFEWIPSLIDGKSYALNPPGLYAVPVDRELFERGAEWLLGNAGEPTALTVLGVVALVATPFLARGRDRIVACLVLGYTFVLVLALVLLARWIGTYFAYRRVESLLPALLLVVGIGIVGGVDRLRSLRVSRPIAIGAGAVALVILVALSLAATVDYYRSEKTNYRAFARTIREAPPDSLVVVGPVDERWLRLIPQYLDWKGVDRPVEFIEASGRRPDLELRPGGVTWLSGAPPGQADMQTRALNDVDAMQVIAGDSSGLLVILPWFASTSAPASAGELTRQRDVIAGLPPFLPAPGS